MYLEEDLNDIQLFDYDITEFTDLNSDHIIGNFIPQNNQDAKTLAISSGCFQFVNAGQQNVINLHNTCNINKMCAIRFASNAGNTQDFYYRLRRNSARQILMRGQSASIIQEADWDFTYGDDASNHVKLYKQNRPHQQLWGINNLSHSFVIFMVKFEIHNPAKNYTSSFGVLRPNKSTLIHSLDAHHNPRPIDVSYRFDPQ